MQKMNLEEKQRIESFEIESPFRKNDHKILQRRKEKYKGNIHNIMSNVHQLLKKFLIKLLCETFNKKEDFQKMTLKDLTNYMLNTWDRFYEFGEDNKNKMKYLYDISSSYEGFLSKKDECLNIIKFIEDIFSSSCVTRKLPNFSYIKLIQEHYTACSNAFLIYDKIEKALESAEKESTEEILSDTWIIIYELCGIICDHFKISHTFDYHAKQKKYSETKVKEILDVLLPAVTKIKNLLREIYDDIQNCAKNKIKKLTNILLNFT